MQLISVATSCLRKCSNKNSQTAAIQHIAIHGSSALHKRIQAASISYTVLATCKVNQTLDKSTPCRDKES